MLDDRPTRTVSSRTSRAGEARSARWHRAALALTVLAAVSTPWASGRAQAAQIEGIRFADELRLGPHDETELTLHGLGLLRFRLVLRGYVAALYLEPDVSPTRVLDDVPRRLEIEYFWGIGAEGFAAATNEGIEQNVSPEQWRSLQPRIRRFNTLYLDVKPGDRYALTYLPGRGTELALNGTVLGSVEGADFASALFSIWLGKQPFDASLKQQLLRGQDSD